MLIRELINEEDEKIYNATIEIWSRGTVRGGTQWSTKRVRERMKTMGYEIRPAIEGRPVNALIQAIDISGTREEMVKQRTNIIDRLMSMSSGKMPYKFILHK